MAAVAKESKSADSQELCVNCVVSMQKTMHGFVCPRCGLERLAPLQLPKVLLFKNISLYEIDTGNQIVPPGGTIEGGIELLRFRGPLRLMNAPRADRVEQRHSEEWASHRIPRRKEKGSGEV